MTVDERLVELGVNLPKPAPRPGNTLGAVQQHGLLYVSGHGPFRDGDFAYVGKVDSTVSLSSAREAAVLTVTNALGTVREIVGELDRISQVVKVFGMVNSDPLFTDQPSVIDAASDFLVEVFGDRGRHARSAVGMAALPMGISVEIEMILALDE